MQTSTLEQCKGDPTRKKRRYMDPKGYCSNLSTKTAQRGNSAYFGPAGTDRTAQPNAVGPLHDTQTPSIFPPPRCWRRRRGHPHPDNNKHNSTILQLRYNGERYPSSQPAEYLPQICLQFEDDQPGKKKRPVSHSRVYMRRGRRFVLKLDGRTPENSPNNNGETNTKHVCLPPPKKGTRS